MLQKSFLIFRDVSAAPHREDACGSAKKIATLTNETAKKTLRDFGTESFCAGTMFKNQHQEARGFIVNANSLRLLRCARCVVTHSRHSTAKLILCKIILLHRRIYRG
jgi:hypothetical protein